eukprot:CAMPEP_0172681248 /NCGR_PEP_ID=MMETSP1074-20121228/17321_1 /TAXON_ID=2916 /ORGANISM="Ceratium fusus, Strain PA161109" /LENGTH=49 /DNA_ID=CAMNT_0013499717 /DNA_START=267 /DNA_END=416 /DNA_ORIENTATION=-
MALRPSPLREELCMELATERSSPFAMASVLAALWAGEANEALFSLHLST